jgi:hypothetical protein
MQCYQRYAVLSAVCSAISDDKRGRTRTRPPYLMHFERIAAIYFNYDTPEFQTEYRNRGWVGVKWVSRFRPSKLWGTKLKRIIAKCVKPT